MIKYWLKQKISEHYPVSDFDVLTPPDDKMGDYSTNLAFTLARANHRNAEEVGTELVGKFRQDKGLGDIFDRIEYAQPGFINFYLKEDFLRKQLGEISKDKNWMLAQVGDITVISRRLDGEYPDVSQVVPEANSSDSAVIKVKEILDAVELALKHPSVKKGGMTPRSNFKFADGSCTLEPPGITVPVEGKTQPSARFDLRYLRDAIKTGNGAEKILWHQKSEDTPLRIDSALGIYVVVSINVR